MATAGLNGQVNAILDEVSKPPDGVILPPKDIRAIVETTAGYVARNGAVFEERIREKERANPKFSFLTLNDAYYPYYVWRLQEVREGRGTAVSAGRVGEAGKAVPEKPKGPTAPPEFHFSARMPNINAQDLDVVKLTALFVAKNGRGFMTTLSQKQAGNYQFDFLRPQHSLHQYFSRLVDQYTDLIQAPTIDGGKLQRARLAEVNSHIKDKFHVLGRAKQRAEWVKYQEQEKQKKEEAEEKERLEYAQIDWHDFVVVETVVFTDADEQADFPAPTSLNDLQSASLEQKAAMSLQPAHMRIEEAMPTGDMAYYAGYGQNQYAMPPPSVPSYNNGTYAPPPPPPMEPPAGYTNEEESAAISQRAEDRDKADTARSHATQPMKIRNDYVPRAKAKRQNVAMGICPNCKQQIPVDEMDEHVRIELLDPAWKEQRNKAQARTYHPGTVDVSANLKRLASQRNEEVGVGHAGSSAEEEARRKRAAMSGEGLDIKEQIRSIHQKYNENMVSEEDNGKHGAGLEAGGLIKS